MVGTHILYNFPRNLIYIAYVKHRENVLEIKELYLQQRYKNNNKIDQYVILLIV